MLAFHLSRQGGSRRGDCISFWDESGKASEQSMRIAGSTTRPRGMSPQGSLRPCEDVEGGPHLQSLDVVRVGAAGHDEGLHVLQLPQAAAQQLRLLNALRFPQTRLSPVPSPGTR